jgi:carbonic anhydrase/acetyltransferase-like protein (isoleucine patch superfamily)
MTDQKKGENAKIDPQVVELLEEGKASEFEVDFVSTSAIKKIDWKFLILYIPILWAGLYAALGLWYSYLVFIPTTILKIVLLPGAIFATFFVIAFGVAVVGKLILIVLNLIHKPKQGVFKIEKGNLDYLFWQLRIQLKKLALWVMNNNPLPWIDVWGFKWFGVQVDFSSHMFDSWVDTDFIKIGRKVTVGQGAVVMSSMILGKYLIIKKVVFDDYTVIGGVSNIAPGTKVGKETIIGAFSTTHYNQELEQGWVYFGTGPVMKLKPNKYAEERDEAIYKKDVDQERRYKVVKKIDNDDKNKEKDKNNKKGNKS